MKLLLVALGIAFVLFAFARADHEQVPVPPTAAAVAAPAVPLSVSETTPPPGWAPPVAAPLPPASVPVPVEQTLYAWLDGLRQHAAWQAIGALVLLSIVAALVVALERSRANE
jgi:hypothetical protein